VSLTLFFYVPLEFALGTWLDRYLRHHGFGNFRGFWLLQGFWVAMLASRLVVAFLLARTNLGFPVLLLAFTILFALCFQRLNSPQDRTTIMLYVMAIGLLLGPIFPILIGILFTELDPTSWGTGYGLAYAIGLLGGTVVSVVFNWIVRNNVQRALNIVVVQAWLLAVASALVVIAWFGR
jgi:fucose permease